MEIEALFGEPLRAARAAGVPAPRLEQLYECLTVLNSVQAASSLARGLHQIHSPT
jgi:ketopantoate reductase